LIRRISAEGTSSDVPSALATALDVQRTPRDTHHRSYDTICVMPRKGSMIASGRVHSAALTVALVLTIATETLPPGQVGTPYLFTLQAQGGHPPYTWSLHPAAFAQTMTAFPLGLPPGLTLESRGTIAGVPTGEREVLAPVLVTDSLGERASRLLRLHVLPPLESR